jgi:hypothetical protein
VIIEHKRPQMPPGLPPAISQLAEECWQQAAEARPSFEQLVARLQVLLAGSEHLVPQASEQRPQSGFVTDF